MRKTAIAFMMLLLAFGLSSIIDRNIELSSSATSNRSFASNGKRVEVYYFYGEGCPHCSRVEPFVAQVEREYAIQFHRFEIYNNRENLKLLDDYFHKYHVPLEEQGIPAIFTLDSYIVGDVDILNRFVEVILPSSNSSDYHANGFDSQELAEPNMSLVSVTIAALADSINPCSIAILLFLVTGLLLLRNREKALKIGCAFAVSVFIANLLFGIGILATVSLGNFSSIFRATAGSIAVLTGILLLKDCFSQGHGSVMEVPKRLRPLLKRQLRKAFFGASSSIAGVFLIGFLVTAFEVPCTGGPYFYILAGMAEDATRLQTVSLLLYYNAIFIMPLILLSTLLYFGSVHFEKLRTWKDGNKKLIDLIRGSMMLFLGFSTIPTTTMIQLATTASKIVKTFFIPLVVFFVVYVAFNVIRNLKITSHISSKIFATFTITLLALATVLTPNTMFAKATPSQTSSIPQTPDNGWSEWASRPVEVNVQANIENENDQNFIYNILAKVQEREWRATVFVTGEFASNHQEIVSDIESRGHQIAVYGWQDGEDLTTLNFQEQFELTQRAFSAVRNATNRPTDVVDFKPQGYKYNDDTIRALQEFGAKSISGLFGCQESFCKCWYAQQLGKITFPYPITNEFWAIPISSIKTDPEDLPLDDEYIHSPSDYLNYLKEKYIEQNETKDPLIIAVHASITGASEVYLNVFQQFLDYVKPNNGKIVTLDSIRHHTAYITNFDATGPSSASVGEEITITVKYTSNVYCPYYRFIMYGRYPGQDWELIKDSPYCEFVYTGPHTFTKKLTIPRSPPNENNYAIRVVGRATFGGCPPLDDLKYWPNYENYDVVKDIAIEVAEPRCIPLIIEDPFTYTGKYLIDSTKLLVKENTALTYVQKYALEYKISPALIMAMIKRESNFDPNAIGDIGLPYPAYGYMQVRWPAARDAGYTGTAEQWKTDGLDPDKNIKYGTSYLKKVYEKWKFSSVYDDPLKNAISAYNAGITAGPTKTNESYVNDVISYYNDYKSKYINTRAYADAIDVVFVPDEDYGGNIDLFLEHVNDKINNRYGAVAPISENMDDFNFYYTEEEADARPGNCGNDLPTNFWQYCPFADAVAVLHTADFGDCADIQARVFSAEGHNTATFLHESSHAIFGLADEYNPHRMCYTDYFQADPHPNIWDSLEECIDDANREGWDATRCRQFCNFWDCGCPNPFNWDWGNWWKIDYDDDIMERGWSTDGFGVACTRRISWIFNQYPRVPIDTAYPLPFAEKAIILHLNINNDQVILLESNVVDDYPPEYINQWEFFDVKTLSLQGELLAKFGIWDPRSVVVEEEMPEDFETWRDNVNFTLVLPYFHNGGNVVITNSTTDELLLSIDISQYATGILNGTVTDYNGLPVSNAFIQVTGPTDDSTFTNADGKYELVGLEPGSYIISATPSPYANLVSTWASVSVSAGETVTRDFVLNPAGSVGGLVTDVNGAPISGVHLFLSGYETPRYQTDEEGRYIIPALEAGTYTVNIDAPSYGLWYIFVNNEFVKYATSVAVHVTLGQTTWVDLSQQPPPMPDIWIDPTSIELTLQQGDKATRILIVGNDGDDILDFEATVLVGSSVFDPSEGTLADIAYIHASIEEPNINFLIETYDALPDYLSGILWLDTDQNPSTGVTNDWWPEYGLNDIGADYAVTIDIWTGYSVAYLYGWIDGYFEFVTSFSVSSSTYSFTLSIPLSNIADDGKMDFTFITYSGGYEVVPNEGHGASAIVPDWASASPTVAQVVPSSQTAITIAIDTMELRLGEYVANIIIESNDLDETVICVPLYLAVIENIPPYITVKTPTEGAALQDGVTFEALVTDSSGVDWVTFSIRESDGSIIDPMFESMSATNVGNDLWQLWFNTYVPQLPDGYYLLLVNASDMLGNEGSKTVLFSIRNWACLELLPATQRNKAGRTMPVKFSLRIFESVDPAKPFVWNEELTIKIYATDDPTNILQTSTYGTTARDYRIDTVSELYITNFKTLKTPKTYRVEIWRKDMLIGWFEFSTVK